MLTNRIFFLSFLIILSTCFSIQSSELPCNYSDHAQEWSSLCAQEMTPEELQLMANFLYLLYINGFLDLQIQRCYAPLLELSRTVRNNLSDPLNSHEETLYLKSLVNKIAQIAKVRIVYTQMLDAFLHHYDQHKNDILERAITDLQNYASDSLYTWADQRQQETSVLLEKSSRKMIDAAQTIYTTANFHTGLRNRELPFVVEEKNKSLAIFNLILKSTPSVMATLDNAIEALNTTNDHAMNIICLGTQTYKEHYQALYEIIASDFVDKNYATILFDMHGLLEPEQRNFLPDTEHIWEHVLETMLFFCEQNKKPVKD